MEGYATAYADLDSEVNFSDERAFLAFMYAEMFSKLDTNANLNFGFSRQGVLARQ